MPLVPDGFVAPPPLTTDQFRLEPLGPQHNEVDHAAWTTSIEHIRARRASRTQTGRGRP